MTQKSSGLAHIAGFDGLRAIAVLAVCLCHTVDNLPRPDSYFNVLLFHLSEFGWAGVDLFFVLSGFLITRILIHTAHQPLAQYLKTFYARRALRIFPLYYCIVIAFLVSTWLITSVAAPLADWLLLLSYTQNIGLFFGHGVRNGYLGHTWSLAVEEHFYLCWPLLLYLTPIPKRVPMVWGLILVSIGLRLYLVSLGYSSLLYFFTPTRIGTLLLGSLLAISRYNAPEVLRRWKLLGALSAALVLGGLIHEGSAQAYSLFLLCGGYELLALAMVAVLACVLSMKRKSFLDWKPLETIGKVSYGVYLLHLPFFKNLSFLINPLTENLPYSARLLILFTLASLATISVALLSYYLFEKKFLELKRHFSYS